MSHGPDLLIRRPGQLQKRIRGNVGVGVVEVAEEEDKTTDCIARVQRQSRLYVVHAGGRREGVAAIDIELALVEIAVDKMFLRHSRLACWEVSAKLDDFPNLLHCFWRQ